MRTLLSLLVVAGIVAGFSLFTVFLPRWRTGHEKTPLVRGVVAASPQQRAEGPVTILAELFPGRPRRLTPEEVTPIDDASPDPTLATGGEGPATFRFELDAGPEDGPRFFVRASVETTAFERFCASAALPPAELVDGEWVDRATGEPLAPVRLAPRERC